MLKKLLPHLLKLHNNGGKGMKEKRAAETKTILFGILILIGAAVWGAVKLSADKSGGIPGATNEERIAYIESFGWDAGTVPTDTREVRIPANFDEAYEQYNALQKEQGFDLRKYRACSVKKFTYLISNYDNADPIVPIVANLLVLDGEIIGADISSAEADGLVTVLAKD